MFFQNPFAEEYRGSIPLDIDLYTPTFICPPHAGRDKETILSWNAEPYDLTGNDTTYSSTNTRPRGTLVLAFCQALGTDFRLWNTLNINLLSALTGYSYTADQPSKQYDTNPSQYPLGGTPTAVTNSVNTAAVKASEIVAVLNADATFSSFWTASVYKGSKGNQVMIRQKKQPSHFKFYVVNGYAEEVFKFNALAGVAELPEYFSRHTVGNYVNFPDCTGSLILLTPGIYESPTALLITSGGVATYPYAINISTGSSPNYLTNLVSTNHGLSAGWKIAVKKSDCYPSIDNTNLVVTSVTGADIFTVNTGTITVAATGTRGYWTTMTNYNVIANARDSRGNLLNYAFNSIKEDFDLLAGRASNYSTTIITYDLNNPSQPNRIIQIIEYPSGAATGTMAKKTIYYYAGQTDAIPTRTWEIPYMLKAADINRPSSNPDGKDGIWTY